MTVQEWLSMLCLDLYLNNLLREGFSSVEQMTGITWEDLEDIGIHKLGIIASLLTERWPYRPGNSYSNKGVWQPL